MKIHTPESIQLELKIQTCLGVFACNAGGKRPENASSLQTNGRAIRVLPVENTPNGTTGLTLWELTMF
jgi:hypothetical protein